jgi:hypothetical protein
MYCKQECNFLLVFSNYEKLIDLTEQYVDPSHGGNILYSRNTIY